MITSELLLSCLMDRPDPRVAATLGTITAAAWRELVDLATTHGVAPLLHHRLRTLVPTTPAWRGAAEELASVYLHSMLRAASMRRQLREVLFAFERAKIPVIALKGADLGAFVYDDAALRPMGDIDLLVREADLAPAERVLRDEGYLSWEVGGVDVDYTAHQHGRPFEKEGALAIELHRAITADASPFRIDIEQWWCRSRKGHLAGVPVRRLAPEDLLIHLCLHTSYIHGFETSLLALYDVALSVRRNESDIDWRVFAECANAARAGRYVFTTLSLVQQMLSAHIPDVVLHSLEHDDADRDVVAVIRDCILGSAVDLPHAYRELHEREALEKVRVLVRSLCPSRPRMREMYELPVDSPSVYWYYLFRPLDLLRRRGRVGAGLLIGAKRLAPGVQREAQRQQIARWVASPNAEASQRAEPAARRMPV